VLSIRTSGALRPSYCEPIGTACPHIVIRRARPEDWRRVCLRTFPGRAAALLSGALIYWPFDPGSTGLSETCADCVAHCSLDAPPAAADPQGQG